MSRVEWSPASSISRWLGRVQDAIRPNSILRRGVQDDLYRIVQIDHERKMLTGITKDGRFRAALSPRTLADPRRGPGPSLVPRFRESRYIKNFVMTWRIVDNKSVLEMSFLNFISPGGFPIPMAHERGVPRKRLPPRPVLGITPQGKNEIQKIIYKFGVDVVHGY